MVRIPTFLPNPDYRSDSGGGGGAGVDATVALLEALERWVDEIPPSAHPARYGNPSYRVWHARLKENAEQLLAK